MNTIALKNLTELWLLSLQFYYEESGYGLGEGISQAKWRSINQARLKHGIIRPSR